MCSTYSVCICGVLSALNFLVVRGARNFVTGWNSRRVEVVMWWWVGPCGGFSLHLKGSTGRRPFAAARSIRERPRCEPVLRCAVGEVRTVISPFLDLAYLGRGCFYKCNKFFVPSERFGLVCFFSFRSEIFPRFPFWDAEFGRCVFTFRFTAPFLNCSLGDWILGPCVGWGRQGTYVLIEHALDLLSTRQGLYGGSIRVWLHTTPQPRKRIFGTS